MRHVTIQVVRLSVAAVASLVIGAAAAEAGRDDVRLEHHRVPGIADPVTTTVSVVDGDTVFAVGVAYVDFRFLYVVRAHDRRSGRVLWQDAPPCTTSSSASTVAVQNGRVIVTGEIDYGWESGGTDAILVVRAHDPATGERRWGSQIGVPTEEPETSKTDTHRARVPQRAPRGADLFVGEPAEPSFSSLMR